MTGEDAAAAATAKFCTPLLQLPKTKPITQLNCRRLKEFEQTEQEKKKQQQQPQQNSANHQLHLQTQTQSKSKLRFSVGL
jgi:hypothetical protein